MKRLFCLMLCAFLLVSYTASADTQRYTASFLDVFDTASQLVIYSSSQEEASWIAQFVHTELLRYHQLFDQYNNWPQVTGVYEVNQYAGERPVVVESELFDLLCFAKDMYVLTEGRTNAAMGSVLQIWHDAREDGLNNPETACLPDMNTLQLAAEHINPDMLVLNEEEQTVFFADPQMRLDLGAIAKGYAVERVAKALEEQGFGGILLSIGGNVRAIGVRPDGTPFPVGIQNPDLQSEQNHIAIARLDNTSLVTSGSYQRFYTVNDQQYHHIIDPTTLMPARYMWAVSVVTEDSGLADALSTALFNMPVEDGQKLIETIPETEALWVLLDGTIITSGGFELLATQ